jgi:hypothetical protein
MRGSGVCKGRKRGKREEGYGEWRFGGLRDIYVVHPKSN